MNTILSIQQISKSFTINKQQQAYLSIRDQVFNFLSKKEKQEIFWALKDISFDVQQGESIGIIGKNGAGKSTLLKILSKITPPTSGKIIANGRLASLLEVGTGFHPELSGRENVFMNGSILGMRKKEIARNFDAIVDFAGVNSFIDTPLKHYSSGMQLRLAFAVAAFLENEILIIDEVLAVGDVEFQQKCMGKMDEVSKSGRTVLFVSHNMAAVKRLCTKGVLLQNGSLQSFGNIEHVAASYLDTFSLNKQNDILVKHNHNEFIQIEEAILLNENLEPIAIIATGSKWKLKFVLDIKQPLPHFTFGIGFKTIEDISFRTCWSSPQDLQIGKYEFIFSETEIYLGIGKYKLNIGLTSRKQGVFYSEDAFTLFVDDLGHKQVAPRADAGIILNQSEFTLRLL